MLFSRAFDISRQPDDDWLDPVLDADVPLFVDPFLLFQERSALWSQAYRSLVTYFEEVFRLLATPAADRRFAERRAVAIKRLTFQDPDEFRLGYSRSRSGSGVARALATDVVDAMTVALRAGLDDVAHFETIEIFNKGIGPDHISDLTCAILKRYFVQYTQQIVERHHLSTQPAVVEVIDEHGRRCELAVELPPNPLRPAPLRPVPVLLVPQRLLRDLPTLNSTAYSQFAGLGKRLSGDVLRRVNKEEILDAARENPASVKEFVLENQRKGSEPYDLESDPKKLWRWEQLAFDFLRRYPVKTRSASGAQLSVSELVASLVCSFRHFIEEEGGWELLWNEPHKPGAARKEKSESAIQQALWAVARRACRDADVSMDREVSAGRGHVDFKFSRGVREQVILETKKLEHERFWPGLERQLPAYARSFSADEAWFVVVQMDSELLSRTRSSELSTRVVNAAQENNLTLHHALLDGRPKLAPSRL